MTSLPSGAVGTITSRGVVPRGGERFGENAIGAVEQRPTLDVQVPFAR